MTNYEILMTAMKKQFEGEDNECFVCCTDKITNKTGIAAPLTNKTGIKIFINVPGGSLDRTLTIEEFNSDVLITTILFNDVPIKPSLHGFVINFERTFNTLNEAIDYAITL